MHHNIESVIQIAIYSVCERNTVKVVVLQSTTKSIHDVVCVDIITVVEDLLGRSKDGVAL